MAINKWMTFVKQCLLKRTSLVEFAKLLDQLQPKADAKHLFRALVQCRETFCAPGDPLISLYLQHVGTTGIVTVSNALVVLASKWNADQRRPLAGTVDCYNQTLQDLTLVIVSPKYKSTDAEIRASLRLASEWLSAVARHLSQQLADAAALEPNNLLEALAFFLASMTATDLGLHALSSGDNAKRDRDHDPVQALRTSIRNAIELCLPMYSILSAPLMARLNTVVKHLTLLDQGSSQPGDAAQASEMQALQFQVSIPDTQIVASKDATMLYLETMLSTGATIDDGSLSNYVCSRHQNDYQSAFTDLCISTFRLMAAHAAESKSPLCDQQLRIFVQHKLPALLSMISASSFNSFSTEQAITDTWSQAAPMISNPDFLTAGHCFLHRCTLHQLMTPEAAAPLLGGNEPPGLAKGLSSKDELVGQIHTNHTRGHKMVEDVARGDGPAGPMAQALVEMMHFYCQSKDTQYLKDLANAILRKPSAINTISLFIRPAYWLGPLCVLLDDWRWDEIHGEAQPVYDDFGAVFLLVLVTRSRLNLAHSDIGIRKNDGFLAQYLDHQASEDAYQYLSGAQVAHLGNWINALYVAEGLSDELFTHCSPHDFYLLLPTLLRQSVVALQQGKLTRDSLKAGLDYLLESFLLPSLVPALHWVEILLREDPTSAAFVLDILMQTPEAVDCQEIHQTILASAAPRLSQQIRSQYPDHTELNAVCAKLKEPAAFSFTLDREFPSVDVSVMLRQQLISVISAANGPNSVLLPGIQDIPSMIHGANAQRGADIALGILIGVLLQLSDSHDFVFALDTVSTLICVLGRRIGDELRLAYACLATLLEKGDTLSAEAVVRLYRQCEAYTNLLTVQDIELEAFAFVQQMSNLDGAGADLNGAAVLSGATDLAPEPDHTDGIDQVLDEAAAMGNLDGTDADMNFEAMYGLQGTEMDLNDLDLDMF